MSSLKIATFNVNSIRSRLHIIGPWLKEHEPDVLCMQETKVADEKFPLETFEEAGYHVVYRGEKQYNGVATASRQKPSSVAFGFDDGGPADEDRLIRTTFPGVTVINTYVPQGRDAQSPQFAYKLQWFSRLIAYFGKSLAPNDPVVWCGDLNVAREVIDVHDPKRLLGHVDFNPDVWEAFDRALAWGFVDLFRKAHPGEAGLYTFFDYRVPGAIDRKLGWRVDHILATRVLAGRLSRCWIDMEPRLAEKASDHTVMIAEFEGR